MMRFFLTCLTVFSTVFCFAEMIDDVEFHLPSKKWKKQNAVVPQGSESLVYVEDPRGQETPTEFFLAHKNQHPPGSFDQTSLEKAISFGFPGMDIKITILSKTDDDVLFEWIALQKGVEKIHGFMRIFSRKGNTVILQFLTEDSNHVEEARKTWLPVLQEAKVKEAKVKE